MSDDWMPSLQMKLSRQEFDQLPRHPAYKYELIAGMTHISPWPRYYNAQLDLSLCQPPAPLAAADALVFRPICADDRSALVPIFMNAFARMQPFGSLLPDERRQAVEECLKRSWTGGDGPLAESASFVAMKEDDIVGAILITLLPGTDPTDWESYRWDEPPPADLWQRSQGQPHLTWIFVNRMGQGRGVGTQLLHKAVRVLRQQGYATLWTTFLLGNDSSLLWHWRNGFELLPHATSRRLLHESVRKT